MNYELFELGIRLSVRFLDSVITVNKFPTDNIYDWAIKNRPVGLGIMSLADYFLEKKITYGSKDSFDELEKVMKFIKEIAEDESIIMGQELGVPEACKNLPIPRRNVTVITIAPTGTISLLAGCNSGIEPFFSEITTRTDKTGTYEIMTDNDQDYFRCAVSSNGSKEVTWEEHVRMQASAQKYVDSAVSKTINFPNHIHKETIGNAFILAWQLGCKGITVYRNGSRKLEVLSPKNLKKDKCPLCGEDVVKYDGCKKCVNCDWSLCEVG